MKSYSSSGHTAARRMALKPLIKTVSAVQKKRGSSRAHKLFAFDRGYFETSSARNRRRGLVESWEQYNHRHCLSNVLDPRASSIAIYPLTVNASNGNRKSCGKWGEGGGGDAIDDSVYQAATDGSGDIRAIIHRWRCYARFHRSRGDKSRPRAPPCPPLPLSRRIWIPNSENCIWSKRRVAVC